MRQNFVFNPFTGTFDITDATSSDNSFEKISKNLKSYDYTLNYTGDVLTSVTYVVPLVGVITKTLNYTLGDLTSIVLSGDLPPYVTITTKSLLYTSGVLTNIIYS
jgi:hypothetical protein